MKVAHPIEVPLQLIAEINSWYLQLFNEEDEDYPDQRKIQAKQRAIDNRLAKITPAKVYQREIFRCITKHTFNAYDHTYKPMCDELRSNGYKVI